MLFAAACRGEFFCFSVRYGPQPVPERGEKINDAQERFLRKGPAGLVVVPLLFALVTLALLAVMFKVFAAPYYSLVEWFMETSVVETQPKDLFDEAAQTLTNTENDRTAQEEPEQETIPLSSITYPSKGDRYGRITIAGTTVDAPVYYGDTNSILNRGVGTYVDSSGAGIPGESKTILMAGHNNTFLTICRALRWAM